MVTLGIPGVKFRGSGKVKRVKYSFKSASEGKVWGVMDWAVSGSAQLKTTPKTRAKRRARAGIGPARVVAELADDELAGDELADDELAGSGSGVGSKAGPLSGSLVGLGAPGLKPALKDQETSFRTRATNKAILKINKSRRTVGPKR
jgi:hypothetical protein